MGYRKRMLINGNQRGAWVPIDEVQEWSLHLRHSIPSGKMENFKIMNLYYKIGGLCILFLKISLGNVCGFIFFI